MTSPTIKQLVASSGFSFAGAVESTGSAGGSGLPADERTVVVQVEQVLHGPEEMAVPPGGRVVVQLSADLPPLGPGDRATFFTNGVAYGDELVVSEVGRLPADAAAAGSPQPAGLAAAVSPVEGALAELAQDAVAEHAAQADAVVRGHVTALAEVQQDRPRGEHDPQWWTATLEVDLVARGDVGPSPGGRGPLVVLYANSLDVRWRESPKPKAGQAGLWLLHLSPPERVAVARFELAHPVDLQPSLQLDMLRERGIWTSR